MKVELTVSSMVCEVCAETVKKAVINRVPESKVAVDLESKKVTVETTAASENEIKEAIVAAGHTLD